MTQYTYRRSTDGCDETFDIIDPKSEHLVSVHFWEAVEQAEADARLIVNALNAYQPNPLKDMTTAKLEKHVQLCNSRYWFEEAAERGYDASASREAYAEYSAAKKELESRAEPEEKSILELAADFRQACDDLVASTKAA